MKNQDEHKRPPRRGWGLIMGIGVGVAIGVALDNYAVGIGVGIAVGLGFEASLRRREPPEGSGRF